jgi:hypothetical protein
LVISLLFANAWKYRIVSVDWLKEQKDALSALSSIITMLILLAGSVFSYYRFFRGRTLSLRLEIGIDVSVHKTTKPFFIHAITVIAKNVGSSTIWNPTPHVTVHIHGPDTIAQEREITGWWEEPIIEDRKLLAPVIDSGETVTFFAHQEIPADAWAVTYTASLRTDNGDSWFAAKTISNKENSK